MIGVIRALPVGALLGIYLLSALVFGVLFAMGLHAAAVPWPADKVLSRSVLLAMALLFFPLVRLLQLSAEELGWTRWRGLHALRFAATGLLTVFVPALFFFWIGFRVLDTRVELASADFLTFVLWAVVSAALVGLFEEVLFRGVLQAVIARACQRLSRVVLPVALTSVCYAAVHFVDRDALAITDGTWLGSWAAILNAVGPSRPVIETADSFAALMLVGVLLGMVRIYSASLFPCIVLHAVWVFGIKVLKEISVRDVEHPLRWLAGDYDQFVGVAVAVWLLIILVGYKFVVTSRQRHAPL